MSERPTGEGEKPAPFWTPDEDLPTADVPAVSEEPVTEVHDAESVPVAETQPEPEAVVEPEPEPTAPTYAAPPSDNPSPPPVPPVPPPGSDAADDPHPERLVLGAFAGGLVLASILRRLGS